MESLGGEVSVARIALVTLYTVGTLLADEKTGLLVAPAGGYRVMIPAVAIGTVRGCEC